jgi:hypothetical protein
VWVTKLSTRAGAQHGVDGRGSAGAVGHRQDLGEGAHLLGRDRHEPVGQAGGHGLALGGQEHPRDLARLCAAATVVSLPVLIAGFLAQDTLVRGLSLGAVK